MEETDLHGAYAIMEHWYQHASARAPNPSRNDMEKARGDFQTLYHRKHPHPPDLTLATHVYMVQVKYTTPSEAEVETSVHCLLPLKAGEHA